MSSKFRASNRLLMCKKKLEYLVPFVNQPSAPIHVTDVPLRPKVYSNFVDTSTQPQGYAQSRATESFSLDEHRIVTASPVVIAECFISPTAQESPLQIALS